MSSSNRLVINEYSNQTLTNYELRHIYELFVIFFANASAQPV